MNIKKVSFITLFSLILSFALIGTVIAEDFLDPDIPESWYQGPQVASEVGIEEFNQSPILNQRVQNGELPSVEQRLPSDPPVIEPYNDIGKYGGSANIWFSQDLNFNTGGWQTFSAPYLTRFGRSTPDGAKVVPSLLKRWEYSDDYRKITYYLREGLKWSDGNPFTSEDFTYWWDHVANNQELTPISPENWDPPLLSVEADGKYEVTFTFQDPVPTRELSLHQGGPGAGVFDNPKHYMKQFHPDFVDKEKLQEEAEAEGLDLWSDYYEYMQSTSHPERGIRPSLNMFIVKERSTNRIVTERNPYFPFVDTAGNQLPYIDEVIRHKANKAEMISTKAATGEVTVAGNNLKVTEIPLYKKNESKENYKTLLYSSGYSNWLSVQPNLSHKDSQFREIFSDLRFRKALSYSIDRENINSKIFYDEAVPRQSTVLPQNKYFKEEYAEAYAEYNPERSRELLDEIGIKDTNGDGFREFPDGETFNPVLIYMKGEGPKSQILELLNKNFDEVGLNVDLKMLNRDLFIQRREGNNFDISMWHLDAATNLMFPNNLGKSFVPYNAWNALTPWPAYVTWSETNGEEGIEPPQKIKDLIEQAKILQTSTDPEKRDAAGQKIVEAQSENLWTIGTVGLGPAPIIINENLKNVPKKGLWVFDISFMAPLYPSQFYFEE